MTHADAAGWDDILTEDEELLWHGRPDATFDFWGEGPVELGFGMTLTGGPLAPMGMLAPLIGFKVLVFLPLVLVGLWLLFGKALWRSYRLGHSWYSITSKRVFVARDLFGRRRLLEFPVTRTTEISETGGLHGGLLLTAPEGYGLLLERLPARQEILTLLWRVQNGARCTPLSTTSA